MQDKQQIYGRNDMVMLYKHNKIYGSLGLTEQFVFDTINGENTVVLNNPKVGKFKDVVTDLNILGNSHQDSTTGKNLFDVNAEENGYIGIDGVIYPQQGIKNEKYGDYIPINRFYKTVCVTSFVTVIGESVDESPWCGVAFYDKDKKFIIRVASGKTIVKANIPENAFYMIGTYRKYKDGVLQIEYGSVSTEYEPYTGGKPSPSPDYPQEIKNVGKWNDEKQKYEVDVKVTNAEQNWSKEQVLTLTSDRPLTKWDRLVEQGGEIGWLYAGVVIDRFDGQSNKISIANKQGNVQNFSIRFENVANGNGNSDIFVDKYRAVQLSYTKAEYGICCNWNDGVKYFSAPNENVATVDEFKAWLIENPLKIAYETTNPEFVPLPQSEQDAVRNLKTYHPTTVIMVDGGELPVGIQATYKQVNK